MGMPRARHVLVKTETGLVDGFAKVLGAAIFRFRYMQNGTGKRHKHRSHDGGGRRAHHGRENFGSLSQIK
jgi:hypothetical protein